jgi:RIO kinase 1
VGDVCRGRLQADTRLTGHYAPEQTSVDLDELMGIIDAAREEERERRERLQTLDSGEI